MISPNGFDSLQWFIGIVEDNADPTNQGRVRVRCFGIHPSYESNEVPTETLPWAIPINGSYGGTKQIPAVSDWVFGFFIDGRDAQHPMLLGVIPGQNLQSMVGSGLPNESGYVKPTQEAYERSGKQSLHPAQSGENLEDTQGPLQNASLQTVTVATEASSDPESVDNRGWSEPPAIVSGAGPRSTIFTSEYGDSYVEINGTRGSETIMISHASGSHIQVDGNGHIKIKSFGDTYTVSEGHNREYTEGRKDITVDGKYTLNVTGGDCTLEVAGNLNHVVHGDYNLNVAGRFAATVGQGFELASQRISMEALTESFNLISAEKIRLEAGDVFSIKAGAAGYIEAGETVDVKADQSLSLGSDSNINIKATGVIAADAGEIHLNSNLSNDAEATPEVAVPPQVEQPTSQGLAPSSTQGGVSSEGSGTSTPMGGVGTDAVDDTDESTEV